jgi:hypothetical protein
MSYKKPKVGEPWSLKDQRAWEAACALGNALILQDRVAWEANKAKEHRRANWLIDFARAKEQDAGQRNKITKAIEWAKSGKPAFERQVMVKHGA